MQTVSELAQKLNRRNARGKKIPPLFLMTDAKRLPDPSALIPRLPTGSAVIIRHFTRAQKKELCLKIKGLCKKHKVKLLISDDLKLALALRLDGVHFPEQTLKKIAGCGSLKRHRPGFLFTAATHHQRALFWAKRAKIDTALLSPIFPTQSHPGKRHLGCWKFMELTRNHTNPVIALGGVSQKNAQRLSQTQASGFAGINGLL